MINLNLPLGGRVKRRNMLLAGFVHGPKEPHDIDSFLYPLVQEIKLLSECIPAVFNAARPNNPDSYSFIRAHIVSVGSDIISRVELMKTLRNRAIAYFEYCHARGIWNGSVYCPAVPPVDPTPEEMQRKGSGYPWEQWELDRNQLPLRTNSAVRKMPLILFVTTSLNARRSTKSGVKLWRCSNFRRSIHLAVSRQTLCNCFSRRSFPPCFSITEVYSTAATRRPAR